MKVLDHEKTGQGSMGGYSPFPCMLIFTHRKNTGHVRNVRVHVPFGEERVGRGGRAI